MSAQRPPMPGLLRAALAASNTRNGRGPFLTNLPTCFAFGTRITSSRVTANITLEELSHVFADRLALDAPYIMSAITADVTGDALANWNDSTPSDLTTVIGTGFTSAALALKGEISIPRDVPQGSFTVALAGSTITGVALSNTWKFGGIKSGVTATIYMLPTTDLQGSQHYEPLLIKNDVTDETPSVDSTNIAGTATVTWSLITRGHPDYEEVLRWRRQQLHSIRKAATLGMTGFNRLVNEGKIKIGAKADQVAAEIIEAIAEATPGERFDNDFRGDELELLSLSSDDDRARI